MKDETGLTADILLEIFLLFFFFLIRLLLNLESLVLRKHSSFILFTYILALKVLLKWSFYTYLSVTRQKILKDPTF